MKLLEGADTLRSSNGGNSARVELVRDQHRRRFAQPADAWRPLKVLEGNDEHPLTGGLRNRPAGPKHETQRAQSEHPHRHLEPGSQAAAGSSARAPWTTTESRQRSTPARAEPAVLSP